MYSYADRMRAVLLYIKLSKRMAPTLHQLGHPTKNALKRWHREYERGDLPEGYVRRKPWYSAEQKAAAVEHYRSHGRCLTHTRKALGYPCHATLSEWINQHEPGGWRRVVGKAVAPPRTESQKQAAVINLCSRQESARQVAQEVGVSRQTLYKWKDQRLDREVADLQARSASAKQWYFLAVGAIAITCR